MVADSQDTLTSFLLCAPLHSSALLSHSLCAPLHLWRAQVQEEVNSPACFADVRFSNDGKYMLAVVEGKVRLRQAGGTSMRRKGSVGGFLKDIIDLMIWHLPHSCLRFPCACVAQPFSVDCSCIGSGTNLV